MTIRNLAKPLLINGRWYDRVKIWGHAAGDALCVTPAHYTTGRRCWIVFADQIADDWFPGTEGTHFAGLPLADPS